MVCFWQRLKICTVASAEKYSIISPAMSTMLANTDVNPNGIAILRSLTDNLGGRIVVIIQNPQDEILSKYFSLSYLMLNIVFAYKSRISSSSRSS